MHSSSHDPIGLGKDMEDTYPTPIPETNQDNSSATITNTANYARSPIQVESGRDEDNINNERECHLQNQQSQQNWQNQQRDQQDRQEQDQQDQQDQQNRQEQDQQDRQEQDQQDQQDQQDRQEQDQQDQQDQQNRQEQDQQDQQDRQEQDQQDQQDQQNPQWDQLAINEPQEPDATRRGIFNKTCFCVTITFILVCALIILVLYNGLVWPLALLSYTAGASNSSIVGEYEQTSNDEMFTMLLPLNSSSTSSVTIKMTYSFSGEDITGAIYSSPIRPAEIKTKLPLTTTKNLTGKSLNYNYYDKTNFPIFLAAGSVLTYTTAVYINSKSYSECPFKLYLFVNVMDYNDFRNGKEDFAYFATSTCNPLNSTQSAIVITTPFNISYSSSYYAGINIDDGVTVYSNISVTHVSFNTSGLDHPSDCSTPITGTSSCTISICGICSNFLCEVQYYFIVEFTGIGTISFDTTTLKVYGTVRLILFIISMVSIALILIIVIILVFVCVCMKKCCIAN